jgi:hypothetical protein
MNVRHINRVATAPTRNTEEDQPDYRSRSAGRAAADRRRYGADERAAVNSVRPVTTAYADSTVTAALRGSLAAMGITADSPDRL